MPAVAAFAVVLVLVCGALVSPRPPAGVSPSRVLAEALRVNTQSPSAPVDQAARALREGCTPVLEGSATVAGKECWAIRLKLPEGKRYPWLEMWIDKNTRVILAWKHWGKRDGRVTVLAQYPSP